MVKTSMTATGPDQNSTKELARNPSPEKKPKMNK